MQCLPQSSARLIVICLTPPRLAQYGVRPAYPKDACHGTDVNDAPVLLRDHGIARDRLGDKKLSTEVGVEHEIPLLPSNLERGLTDVEAGVVDQDIYLFIVLHG